MSDAYNGVAMLEGSVCLTIMLSTTLLRTITIFKWDVSQVGLALYQLD